MQYCFVLTFVLIHWKGTCNALVTLSPVPPRALAFCVCFARYEQ